MESDVFDYPFRQPGALEPPDEWARLRQECPVARIKLETGDEAVLLTRHEDVKSVLADPRFSRQMDADDAARLTADESGGPFGGENTVATGDAHLRWRRIVGRYFTAKRMADLRPRIAEATERFVGDMVRHGAPADLGAAVGFPLPVWVICQLLAVPDADRDRFAYWSDTLLNLNRYEQSEIDAAQAGFVAYLRDHIADRRANPGDDLISELVAVHDADDGRLSEGELLMTAQGLLIAGHETTSSMISKMAAILLSDRRRWERLLAEPALVRTAVEELLRFDTNAGFGVPRYLSSDVTVSAGTIAAGTTVICQLGAANRDPDAIDRADELDVTRAPNGHLTFGAGPHSCIGQALARTELQTVLEVLLRTLPTLELAVPPEQLRPTEGLIVGGLHELPVRW
ncbi:cytochrome P450 [Amycolatopsis minnesotensis]|uniref:Cytochrome P450 n=1 Tax=Amycolatopsis minnesotensis TaxID=337894 RepID=A0ABN2QB50_9PSEU